MEISGSTFMGLGNQSLAVLSISICQQHNWSVSLVENVEGSVASVDCVTCYFMYSTITPNECYMKMKYCPDSKTQSWYHDMWNIPLAFNIWATYIVLLSRKRTSVRFCIRMVFKLIHFHKNLGAVSIRKTVLPGMAIPMLKIRRPNGRLIFNMEIAIRR